MPRCSPEGRPADGVHLFVIEDADGAAIGRLFFAEGLSAPGSTQSTSTRACAGAAWGARRCSRSRSVRAPRRGDDPAQRVRRERGRARSLPLARLRRGGRPDGEAPLERLLAVDAGVSLPGHAGGRRQGDQARRVPSRPHAGGRARARRPRARGGRRDGRRSGELVHRRRVRARGRAHRPGGRGLGDERPPAEGQGADRARIRPPPRGPDPLHLPPHRRGRAADARALVESGIAAVAYETVETRGARCRCSRR